MTKEPPKLGEIVSEPSTDRPVTVPPSWVRKCGRRRVGEECGGNLKPRPGHDDSFFCTKCRAFLHVGDERITWAPKKVFRHYSRIEHNGFPGVSVEMTEAISMVMADIGITRPELLRRALAAYPPLAAAMERITTRAIEEIAAIAEKRALIGEQARQAAIERHAEEQERINALPIETLGLTLGLREVLLPNGIETVGQLKALPMPDLLKFEGIPYSAVGEIKAALKRLDVQLTAIERRLIEKAEIAAGIEVTQTHTLTYCGTAKSTKLIVVLRDVKGMSWDEISAEVGLKPVTVKANYAKALSREPKTVSPERLAEEDRVVVLRGRGKTWTEIGDSMNMSQHTAIVRYREARKRKRGLR